MEKPSANMVRMRQVIVRGADDADFLLRRLRPSRRRHPQQVITDHGVNHMLRHCHRGCGLNEIAA
jgi:hypothetical protein